MALVHYLLVYDHQARELRSHDGYADADQAVDEYSALERRHRHDKGVEIVLVSAESLDVIRQTHGHYFTPASAPLAMPLQMPARLAAIR